MLYDDYAEYTQKYKREFRTEDALVLIEVGSFWELYDCDRHLGADMSRVSDLLGIQVTRKSKAIPEVSRTNPLMAGFPSVALDRFLPTLLNTFTVILVSQVTPPPNPKREVTHILSKGTHTDLIDGSSSSSNGNKGINWIASAFVEHNGVGAAILDLSTGTSYCMESFFSFTGTQKGKEKEKEHVDELCKWLAIYQPCELILFGSSTDLFEKKKGEFQSCRIFNQGPEYDKNVTKASYQTAVLTNVLRSNQMSNLAPIERTGLERNWFALAAFVQLIDYCKRHNERIVRLLKPPELNGFEECGRMRLFKPEDLDLPLVETLMNRCVTAMGRRMFGQRLRRPYLNPEDMQRSYDAIDVFVSMDPNEEKIKELRTVLKTVYDLERLFRKCRLKSIKPNEVDMIASSLNALASLDRLMEKEEKEEKEITHLLKDYDASFPQSIPLKTIRKRQEEQDEMREAIARPFAAILKCERTERDGTFATLTPKRFETSKTALLAAGFIKMATTSATTVKLGHPKFDQIEKELKRLEQDEKSAMQLEFDHLLDAISGCEDEFDPLIKDISDLDFATTCALNALEWNYCRPHVLSLEEKGKEEKETEEGERKKGKIEGLRHPWVERNSIQRYVENDLTIGSHLIYGLNSSGKSTLMKAAGLTILLAQAGMYVPCTNFTFTPFDAIFCRISKGDRLSEGMSTFVVEMSDLRTILRNATHRSLVLGDELCAGTEHDSAIAIVCAGIQRLQSIGASFIFATHIHELPGLLFLSSHEPIQICHLDAYFDREQDVLVYNRTLMPGSGSSTYGIEVCRALGLDHDFIEAANKTLTSSLNKVKKSPYGTNVFSPSICSICKIRPGQEFHHIVPQAAIREKANTKNKKGKKDNKEQKEQKEQKEKITKNNIHHASNQTFVCSKCHDLVHAGTIEVGGYLDTSQGLLLKIKK